MRRRFHGADWRAILGRPEQRGVLRLVIAFGVAVVLGVGVVLAVLRPTLVRPEAGPDGTKFDPSRSPGSRSRMSGPPGSPPSPVAGSRLVGPGSPGAAGSGAGRPEVSPGAATLLTNEYAYHHQAAADAVRSPDWVVTSGSLYSAGGLLWSGHPDDQPPGPISATGTDSAVLRAVSTRTDHGDVRVSFGLRILEISQTRRTPAKDTDGVHIFLRYQSEFSTYYVSVFRRDGRATIKKKVPGGPSNGGTYFTLASAPLTLDGGLPGAWHRVEATAVSVGPEVRLALSVDGHPTLDVTDGGTQAPVIATPGRVGLRGDNTEFYVRDFRADPFADQ